MLTVGLGVQFAMLQQMSFANKVQENVAQHNADDTHRQAYFEHVVLLNQSC